MTTVNENEMTETMPVEDDTLPVTDLAYTIQDEYQDDMELYEGSKTVILRKPHNKARLPLNHYRIITREAALNLLTNKAREIDPNNTTENHKLAAQEALEMIQGDFDYYAHRTMGKGARALIMRRYGGRSLETNWKNERKGSRYMYAGETVTRKEVRVRDRFGYWSTQDYDYETERNDRGRRY